MIGGTGAIAYAIGNDGSSLNYVDGPSRNYSLCPSVFLWLGQRIAVHHRGAKMQRICDSSSPILYSEEPKWLCVYLPDNHSIAVDFGQLSGAIQLHLREGKTTSLAEVIWNWIFGTGHARNHEI